MKNTKSSEKFSPRTPEQKKLSRRESLKKSLAMLALTATVFSMSGCNESPIIPGASGPEVELNGSGLPNTSKSWLIENLDVVARDKEGKPKSYIDHMANIIEVREIDNSKTAVLNENADVRTSPIVGSDDGERTTIVTLGEPVTLERATEYLYLDRDTSGDSFYGFFVDQVKPSLPNVDLVDYDGKKDHGKDSEDLLVWVKSNEVSFE